MGFDQYSTSFDQYSTSGVVPALGGVLRAFPTLPSFITLYLFPESLWTSGRACIPALMTISGGIVPPTRRAGVPVKRAWRVAVELLAAQGPMSAEQRLHPVPAPRCFPRLWAGPGSVHAAVLAAVAAAALLSGPVRQAMLWT